ncbi:MAG: arginine--tRNA ligase [Anaerolineae bacterium]
MVLVRDEIAQLIAKAIRTAQKKGELPSFDLSEVPVTRARDETFGDYASPVCMTLARVARMAPLAIAQRVIARMPPAPFIGKVEAAHPGFINISLAPQWLSQQVEVILTEGERFGQVDLGKGRSVQVEYISANPTGPLTVGSGRNGVLGDALANVLAAAGWRVHREYYINDTGTQIDLFAASLYARYVQALGRDEPLPEGGYPGSYLVEMGHQLAQEYGDCFLTMERSQALAALREEGLKRMLASIQADAAALGIRFDNWKSERSLYEDGTYSLVFNQLSAGGWLVYRDGAVWFTETPQRSSGEDRPVAEEQQTQAIVKNGQDKDNVVVRSDGRPTYFASDIAYVWDKLVTRGFDRAIYVWGADHQGHVPRMKAVTRALGLDPERITIILYQLVTLKRGGELVRMGKRTGEIITLREVVEEIGADATRFMLLTRAADSQMELDLTLAVQQSSENPVYYVQYGHARIASIFRYAQERGFSPEGGDVRLLTHPAEQSLIRQMVRLPEIVALCAETLSPHHLTHYAQELATAFHTFYKECRVVSEDAEHADIGRARLKLVQAAKIVLANTLHLIGVSAPESM